MSTVRGDSPPGSVSASISVCGAGAVHSRLEQRGLAVCSLGSTGAGRAEQANTKSEFQKIVFVKDIIHC